MDFIDKPPPGVSLKELELIPPHRVYGRLDSIEPDVPFQSGPTQLYFDCIEATWFDHNRPLIGTPHWLRDCRASIVSLRFDTFMSVPADLPVTEGSWVEFQFQDNPTTVPIDHYLNLFLPPVQRFLIRVEGISEDLRYDLERSVSMDDLPDAQAEDIETLLPTDDIAACLVADVGQGNCNAPLCDEGFVLIYYDFGGGVLGNRATFPKFFDPCFTRKPSVILSHWDWDHWSAAQRVAEFLPPTPWIVPRQSLGGVHRKFLTRLEETCEVNVWPAGLSSIGSNIRIEKCTGAGRNHSGLAVILESPHMDGQRILLTGDARYSAIPSALELPFTSVVVPHHGGSSRGTRIPSSDARPNGRIAYSYGLPNIYGHPLESTSIRHLPVWGNGLHTAQRSEGEPSQVRLYWDESDPDCYCDHFRPIGQR